MNGWWAPVFGFLLGSVPGGYFLARWKTGLDARREGSGNVGATNVFRIAGPFAGAVTLLIDVFKGGLAVYIALRVSDVGWLAPVTGMAAVLGHVYSPWLSGRGGKGAATTAGALLVLAPVPAGITMAVFALVTAASRRVSVGTVAAAATFPVTAIVLDAPGHVVEVGVLLAFLLAWWHRDNLRRLARGMEPPLWGPGARGERHGS